MENTYGVMALVVFGPSLPPGSVPHTRNRNFGVFSPALSIALRISASERSESMSECSGLAILSRRSSALLR